MHFSKLPQSSTAIDFSDSTASDEIQNNENGAPNYYGATNGIGFSPGDKITYSWTNIDVYGHVDQNAKGLKYYLKKMKNSCLRHTDPTLRKQILKNGMMIFFLFDNDN